MDVENDTLLPLQWRWAFQRGVYRHWGRSGFIKRWIRLVSGFPISLHSLPSLAADDPFSRELAVASFLRIELA